MSEVYDDKIKLIEKPCILISGPGCGKTSFIVDKIKYLKEINFDLEKILCLTFSSKSSNDMSKKISKEFSKDFIAYTFHSFCLDIIMSYEKFIVDIDRNFEILTEDFGILFFFENFENLNITSIEIKNNKNKICYDLYSKIMSLKENGISPKDVEKLEFSNINIKVDILSTYLKYEEYKRKNNLLDFCDILNITINLLEKNEFILKELKDKYKYILVDEFQDTNLIQLKIIKLMAKNNISIVLDQKQSIYSFRGSNFENLELFKKHFENHQIYYLNKNYRSSKNIINFLNQMIEKEFSKDEKLIPVKDSYENPRAIILENENSQNEYILFLINDFLKNQNEKNLAILTRTNFEAKKIFEFLKLKNIDISFKSTKSFYEDPLLMLIHNILKIIISPKDSNIEFFYILEKYSISNGTIKNLFRKIQGDEKSFYEVLKNLETKDFGKNEKVITYIQDLKTLNFLKENIFFIIDKYRSNFTLTNILILIFEKFKFFEKYYSEDDKDSFNMLKDIINFSQRFSKIKKVSSVKSFLEAFEHFQINSQNNSQNNKISILTIHNSKGLEFDTVIIPNLIENIYPLKSKNNLFDEKSKIDIEEEKRVFFVSISRAKENLFLLSYEKNSNNSLVKLSSFLDYFDIKKERIQTSQNFSIENCENEIKKEILKNINFNMMNNEIELVKKEVELYEVLFNKNKNLNSHLLDHPNFEFFKNKLENSKKTKIEHISKLEVEKYSHSKLSTYSSCPKKYLYSYEYRIPSLKQSYFDFGTTIHFVLEEITKLDWSKYEKKELFLLALEILTNNWISHGYTDYKQEETYKKKSIKIIEDFIEKNSELLQNQSPKHFERKFEIEINGEKVSGIIDRVDYTNDDEIIILDYKTSNKMKTKKELLEDKQLYIYAIASKKEFGKYPKKMGLWFLGFNEIQFVDFDEVVKNKIKDELNENILKIKEKNFEAKPTWFNCTYCDFNQICENSYFNKN